MPPQGWGMRRPAINGEQGFSPSDGRFLGSLVGAGTKVCGTIEYGPPTRCGPNVNRRLVSARVELPPEHAAILVEEICSHGYARNAKRGVELWRNAVAAERLTP